VRQQQPSRRRVGDDDVVILDVVVNRHVRLGYDDTDH
jgi:hypothetical protein